MPSGEIDCGSLNATECILQVAASILSEIKESNREFNWDPASFIVTLIIGIFAAFFAGLAIVQGLLAAGPGRHKCSRYAIGSWAQFTTHKLDWSELRYRTVAQTPLLEIERFLYWTISDDNNHRGKERFKYIPKDFRDHFPATWLLLLSECLLDHPKYWNRSVQGTDYLPSDLAAAPAYSCAWDLVTFMAIASHPHKVIVTIDEVTKVLSVQGHGMDLDFRTHPFLGTYAVFQAWDLSKRYHFAAREKINGTMREKRAREIKAIIRYAKGEIPLRSPFDVFQQPLERFQTPPSVSRYLNLKKSGPMGFRQPFPAHECRCESSSISSHLWQDWCSLHLQLEPEERLGIPFDTNGSGIRLLSAKTVMRSQHPTLFPWKCSKDLEGLKGLIAFSRLWSNNDYKASGKLKVSSIAAIPNSDVVFSPSNVVLEAAYEYVSRMLWDRIIIQGQERPILEDRVTKFDIYQELHKIDDWIGDNKQEVHIDCRIRSLSYAASLCHDISQDPDPNQNSATLYQFLSDLNLSGIKSDYLGRQLGRIQIGSRPSRSTKQILERVYLLKIREMDLTGTAEPFNQLFGRLAYYDDERSSSTWGPGAILPDVFRELCKLLKLWELDFGGESFIYATDKVQHYLDDLLIYRAIMIAIIFQSATDNTDIIRNPTYGKTIPFI